ncbi:hypothetical protein CDV36_012964 [Fusarium kuroshium]|uniref:Adenine deaminase n=1 Tax=Fusarium kuroshium TaxID=2010991 RepID=A0A3M2RRH5_9HYPO|nr:hypothetical protein CDV36_012964 [Fusarium kuroshium]
MCNSHLHDFLFGLPKCEHHLHIEGTVSPELLFTLAAKNSITLDSADDPAFTSVATLYERYRAFTSLDDFLHYYFIGFSVLQTQADFELLAYEHFKTVFAQGLRHTEIFFDPQAHSVRGISYQTVISGLIAAKTRAAINFPEMSVEFIPCAVRHLPLPSAHDMLASIIKAGHFSDGTVAGFGLSSTELNMHPSLFKSLYETARDAGVANLTAHYGEEGPAGYVEAAISELKGQVLRGVDQIHDMPIRALLDAGVPFSINSDDPAYFGGGLLDNYCAVQEAFELSVEQWERIARNSAEGSWCDRQRKDKLLTMIADAISSWRTSST